jgi:hypothetical protein
MIKDAEGRKWFTSSSIGRVGIGKLDTEMLAKG